MVDLLAMMVALALGAGCFEMARRWLYETADDGGGDSD